MGASRSFPFPFPLHYALLTTSIPFVVDTHTMSRTLGILVLVQLQHIWTRTFKLLQSTYNYISNAVHANK